MELLAEELVASVFQFIDLRDLGRMAVVCHAWKGLTENPVLRLDINSITLHDMTIDNVYNITRGIRKCEKLRMNKCMISCRKLGNIIKDISSALRSIKLVSCILDDRHTNKIFQAAGTCKHLEKLIMISKDPKLNLFLEQDTEPLLQCEKLHTIDLDGLEVMKFETISLLMNKVWRFNFTTLDWPSCRKIIYVHDINAFYANDGRLGYKIFPHPGIEGELPVFPDNYSVTYTAVKWTFKSETYQIVQREKLFLVDRDEIINEDLQDLSADMQVKVKDELAKNKSAYIMVTQFQEECLQMREPTYKSQIDYNLKTRPPFWRE
jgi:hypothetical protein